jgi:hypothetical protein
MYQELSDKYFGQHKNSSTSLNSTNITEVKEKVEE